jgi:protein-S-isoprenylcysteine O-methyltransferase Ste14
MIIPIVIAGITLGSLLVSEKHSISKKKLLGVSALSGLLNLANAYLVYLLFPPPTFTRTGTGAAAGQFAQARAASTAGSETSFYASSFIIGFLIVLAVVGIALAYAHFKTHKAEEEDEEEKEPKLEDEETKA